MTIDLNRRRLLQSGAIGGLAALPGMGVFRNAQAAGSPTTLISIHLDGGNDTLNTVIPYANPEYYRLRGEVAIPVANSLKLDAANALHPSLVNLKALWDRSRVAIVHGVGYPSFNYSHFQAKQILWTADPTMVSRMGWLGRSVDAMVSANPNIDVLTAVTLGGETRPLQGQRFVPVQVPYEASRFVLGARNTAQANALKQLMALPANTFNPLLDRVLQGSQTALKAYDNVQASTAFPSTQAYPYGGTLPLNLRMAVQLMRSDPDIRVITLNTGDFDHHVTLNTKHAPQLTTLDSALKAFTDDLDLYGLSGRVLIMITSDFGRRVIPNSQNGTDHGAAQAMIFIGAGVRPGIVGVAPQLTQSTMINNGNLPMQFDFRQVYSTVLAGWLEVDPATGLTGGPYTSLPILL